MADQINPYAPPKSDSEAERSGGYWRDGKRLVLHQGADLPHRCVKCNAPAEMPIKARKVYWHHPALYLVILLNLLIFAIIALIVRKSIKVSPGLCAEHRGRRRMGLTVAWLGFAVFFGSIVAFAADSPVLGGTMILVGLIAMIVGANIARILYAKKIDSKYAWLNGCGAEFLESLPPVP